MSPSSLIYSNNYKDSLLVPHVLSEVVMSTIVLAALGIATYTLYQLRSGKEKVRELELQVESLRNGLGEVKSIVGSVRRGLEERVSLVLGELEEVESRIRVLEDRVHVGDKLVIKMIEDVKYELSRLEGDTKAILDTLSTRVEKLEIAYTGLSSRARRIDGVEKEVEKIKGVVESLKSTVEELEKRVQANQPMSREERDRILVEKWLKTPLEERSVNKIAKEFGIHPSTAMRILRKHLGENYRKATWSNYKHGI